jgi:hypothetical protein
MKLGVALSWILKVVMVTLILRALWREEWVWALGGVIALAICLVPTILKRNYEVTVPWQLDLLIVLALWIHIAGEVTGRYYTIPHYDTIAHFASSLLVAFVAFTAIYILDKYWDGLKMDKYAMAYVVVVTTMAMGVVWEFFEWGIDLLFGFGAQWGLQDTMKDLLVDTIGGIVMAIIGVNLIKKGEMEEMVEGLEKLVPKREYKRRSRN